jgi:hypothetical protein
MAHKKNTLTITGKIERTNNIFNWDSTLEKLKLTCNKKINNNKKKINKHFLFI